LLRAPLMAEDSLRASLSFSRLDLAADHAPLFGDDVGASETEPSSPGGCRRSRVPGRQGRCPRGRVQAL
jgi:hypothetical protein